MNFVLFLPILNPGQSAGLFLRSLARQRHQPEEILVVDSESDDGSVEAFRAAAARVVVIPRESFDHGGTRQMAAELCPEADVVMFLTQDAVLAGTEDLEKMLACFEDERVGAVYGRQLPHQAAGPIGAHARLFNYPPNSRVSSAADIPVLGIRTAFLSNSFAAYRRSALMEAGGFPRNLIFGEDTYVAARLLQRGWKVAYCAEAQVFHSHDYSPAQEFRRYFDMGVLHGRESWLRREFGQPHGEGFRFVRSEFAYLKKHRPLLIPSALARSALKLLAYRLGLAERHLPLWLKRNLSGNRNYWTQKKAYS